MKKWYIKIIFLIVNISEILKNNKIYNVLWILFFGMIIRKNDKLLLIYLILCVVLEFKCLLYVLYVYIEVY